MSVHGRLALAQAQCLVSHLLVFWQPHFTKWRTTSGAGGRVLITGWQPFWLIIFLPSIPVWGRDCGVCSFVILPYHSLIVCSQNSLLQGSFCRWKLFRECLLLFEKQPMQFTNFTDVCVRKIQWAHKLFSCFLCQFWWLICCAQGRAAISQSVFSLMQHWTLQSHVTYWQSFCSCLPALWPVLLQAAAAFIVSACVPLTFCCSLVCLTATRTLYFVPSWLHVCSLVQTSDRLKVMY